jgi:hypothetical protein
MMRNGPPPPISYNQNSGPHRTLSNLYPGGPRVTYFPCYPNSAFNQRTRTNSGGYVNNRGGGNNNYQPDSSTGNRTLGASGSSLFQRVTREIPRNWPTAPFSSSDSDDNDEASTNRKRHHSRSEVANVAKKVAAPNVRVKQQPVSPDGSGASEPTTAVKREPVVKVEAVDAPSTSSGVVKREAMTPEATVKTEPRSDGAGQTEANVLCDCPNCFPSLGGHGRSQSECRKKMSVKMEEGEATVSVKHEPSR